MYDVFSYGEGLEAEYVSCVSRQLGWQGEQLICAGTMSRDEIESSYKISRRIEGEERALDVAMMVFTSTQQEVRPLGCPLITEG